jgi:hypothetical protein
MKFLKEGKLKKVKGFIIMVAALVVAIPTVAAVAQTPPQQGGSGLSISPTRFELVIEPGKAELAAIQVKNVTDDVVVARAYLNDFEPDGNTGNPKLIIDENIESSTSLREFIVGLTDVTIAPGETVPVDVPIQVPEDAAPGAYYGAVRFAATPEGGEENQNAQLTLNASVAALVLVEVPGNITEKIEIKGVQAFLNDKGGSIFTKKPSQVGIEINNLGNGFSKPFGRVAVNGPWGSGEVHSYELNSTSPKGNVLPASSRLFKDELKGVTWPGRYTIQANISHGRGGEILTASAAFWYLPTWFLIAVLLVLLLVVGSAYFLYKKYVTKSTRRR